MIKWSVQMYLPIIDAHIHLDRYKETDRHRILLELNTYNVDALISVSNNLQSAQKNLQLSKENRVIKPAFGFHPEQKLPNEEQLNNLLLFIEKNATKMIAIGEVGLPYYLRREDPTISIEPYIQLLEIFIKQAVKLDKPIVLHAIYDDAPIVCDLLEKYSIHKAHFHWFKGDPQTIERMIRNEYFISITPDVVYEEDIQQLINDYPLSQMMVETDGPWRFKGPFKYALTHPNMIHQTINKIAMIKRLNNVHVYKTLYANTKQFYNL